MRREPGRLEEGRFDLLVVGGGIYGAWAAYDAALRGLSVAIVERTDWAAGTSSASSKLIHGGLRYLEHLWLFLVRKTLAERSRLARLGPHRVRPIRFVLPVYRGDRLGKGILRAGLSLYDALAPGGGPVGAHRSLGPEEVLRACPFLRGEDLVGGFEYGDCLTDDARFTLEVVSGALAAGAVAVNHAQVTSLLQAGGRVAGARVHDEIGGREIEVRASVVLDAAGPWLATLFEAKQRRPLERASKGVHLLFPALTGERALLLTARSDGRPIFLIPWYGRTLLGTTDTEFRGRPEDARVEPEDVDYLLSEANRALGGAMLREADVLGCFAGVRTLRNGRARTSSAVSREWRVEEPVPGLLVSVGGKLTSARADAALAVDRVLRMLGRPPRPAPTAERPFPWCPREPFEEWIETATRRGVELGADPETARGAALRYGSTLADLNAILATSPELAARLDPALPFCRAEVVHAVRGEMALNLEDVLRRRIPLSILGRFNESATLEAARLVAAELGWSAERRAAEIGRLLATCLTSRAPGAQTRIPSGLS